MQSRTILNCLKRMIAGIFCLALSHPLTAQALERFLDQPRPASAGVRLVVFNPTAFNIRGLAALRDNGILDIPGLTVIGVFHTKQKDDFEDSRKLVREKRLDWFKFHAVSGEISESTIFKKNACTPEFETILKNTDGVIFFGGPDIPSSIFHRKTNFLVEITDPFRHYLELSAIFHFFGGTQDIHSPALLDSRPAFPVLGICLGFQSLNVGTGGTLVQDIWSDIYRKSYVEDAIALGPEQWHNNPYQRLFPRDNLMGYNFHTLKLSGKGKLAKDLGFKTTDHPKVLSSHHQALGLLGKGWTTIATSRDGKVIEAIEHKKFPNVLGIQFHPEHPMLWDTEPRFRQKPGDPLTSYNAILAGTPASLEFNKAIWKWFGGKLKESQAR
ncbi:MAG: gamma-glutamyl-gamma-aminobutyrate hydrolase family protein [Holophagaceae bacterium]|nr:gamma-glutamyl-gamma-aminobutyrate hydrolase family protein [Holophagaceae bacterium]